MPGPRLRQLPARLSPLPSPLPPRLPAALPLSALRPGGAVPGSPCPALPGRAPAVPGGKFGASRGGVPRGSGLLPAGLPGGEAPFRSVCPARRLEKEIASPSRGGDYCWVSAGLARGSVGSARTDPRPGAEPGASPGSGREAGAATKPGTARRAPASLLRSPLGAPGRLRGRSVLPPGPCPALWPGLAARSAAGQSGQRHHPLRAGAGAVTALRSPAVTEALPESRVLLGEPLSPREKPAPRGAPGACG